MQVPFRLRRRPTAAPAAALWLAGADTARLAALCARLGGAALPDVYAVAGGFVIVPDGRVPAGLPRAVRLRRLAGHLYLPADAEMVPALHSAEAAEFTRRRGLVVLPGGQALAFDPDRPLAVAEIVAPAAVRRGDWELFPPRPPLAERLHAIERAEGDEPPEAILDRGRPGREPDGEAAAAGAGAGADELRPADAPPLRRAAGRARLGLGRLLAWLGRKLGRPDLAKLGANLIRRAVESVPRLTERVLGRQEAALRELLRRFRSGDIERALRQAPAAVPDPDAPQTIDTGWRLGDRNPRYSLAALLGGGGGGGVWLGGGNVWAELTAEYHRVARAAIARGDYRRAAYVYGALLRDFRLAADTLAAGGLHRDAAILYRDRLHDAPAAAAAFEQAGDFDEALRLYRQAEQFDRAGDLLRRLGDEDAAIEAYMHAANRLAQSRGWLVGGDFFRDRAGRIDIAMDMYQLGWRTHTPGSVGCAERLLDYHLAAGALPAVWQLLSEAEDRFAPPGGEHDAGRFFAAVARAAERPLPDEARSELRDRARLALAGHLREHARTASRPGTAVSDLFGREAVWPAPVVRDAAFALQRSLRPEPAETAAPVGPVVRLLSGPVTAAIQARGSFDIVVGSATGEVICWRADNGQVERVTNQGGPVAGLATDGQGRLVVVLRRDDERGRLRSFVVSGQNGQFQYLAERELFGTPESPPRLLPAIRLEGGDFRIDVCTPDGIEELRGTRLLPVGRAALPDRLRPLHLLCRHGEVRWVWGGNEVHRWRGEAGVPGDVLPRRTTCYLPWQPDVPDGSSLREPPIDWLAPHPDQLVLAGLTRVGELYWVSADVVGAGVGVGRLACAGHASVSLPGGFRAAALARPDRLAAVTAANEVQWFRAEGQRLRDWAVPRRLPVPARAVAAFNRPGTDALAVVFEDGSAVCVPWPR